MNREQMLARIEELRKQGHFISFDGHKGEFNCDFDNGRFTAASPEEAFYKAEKAMLGGGNGEET